MQRAAPRGGNVNDWKKNFDYALYTVIFSVFQFILVLDSFPFAYIKHIAH